VQPDPSSDLAISMVLPRIVLVFEAGLGAEAQEAILLAARSTCPGVACIPLNLKGVHLYEIVILPGFARAARWQEMAG